MLPVLRLAAGVCALSMTAALHAATPISLPIGDIGLHADDDLELPVPPPPRTTVQVSGLLVPGCRVEIDLTAALP